MLALGYFEGNLWAGAKATMAIFIDQRADDKQREALQMVFGGQAGGWPGQFAKSIAEVRGIEFVPIEFSVADNLTTWRAAVPGRIEAVAEALGGPTTLPGQLVQTFNPPGSEVGPERCGDLGDRDGRPCRRVRLQVEPQRTIEQAHPVLLERPGLT